MIKDFVLIKCNCEVSRFDILPWMAYTIVVRPYFISMLKFHSFNCTLRLCYFNCLFLRIKCQAKAQKMTILRALVGIKICDLPLSDVNRIYLTLLLFIIYHCFFRWRPNRRFLGRENCGWCACWIFLVKEDEIRRMMRFALSK